jgi:CII-binding regulator of phage lambda lysogenization HflD
MMANMQKKTDFGSSYNIGEKLSPVINASTKLDSVDTKNQGLFDFITKSSEDTKSTTASLNDGITRLYTIMENQTTSTTNAEKSMQEMVGLIRAQLSKHDDMINELRNNVSVNQKILTNSYS